MGTINNPSYRQRLGYHAILLGAMGLFASVALVSGNIATQADISQRVKDDMLFSLEQAIPPSNYDNDLFEDTIVVKSQTPSSKDKEVKVFRARKNNSIIAVAYKSTATGYSGPIEIIMGIDKNGSLLGVRIISHSETPGLGDKIEVKKDNWITKFTGLSFSNTASDKWKVKKDGGQFDQFTGATITPRAVVKAVYNGLLFFSNNKKTLFFDPKPLKAVKTNKNVHLLKNEVKKISPTEIMSMLNKIQNDNESIK